MKLVKARCPECGGILDIDSEKKAAICQYCKSPFIVEEAINNYVINKTVNNNTVNNITNVTNISGSNVVINQDELNRFWVIEGTTLVKYNGKQRNLRIPDNITEIARGAISDVEEIVIPSSVTYIAERAIVAKKVTIRVNYDIELAKDFFYGEEVEFEEGFGKFEGLSCKATIKFNNLQWQDVFIAHQTDMDKLAPNCNVLYKGDEIKTANISGATATYIAKSHGNAQILCWGQGFAQHYFSTPTVDFSEINGCRITSFKNEYVQNEFWRDLTNCWQKIRANAKIQTLNLPEGLTTTGGARLVASQIRLPSTLKVIVDYTIEFWDKIYIPLSARLDLVSGFAFTNVGYVSTAYKRAPLNLSVAPKTVGNGALQFLRVNGAEIGKMLEYIIETDIKCDEIKVLFATGWGDAYSRKLILKDGVAKTSIAERYKVVTCELFYKSISLCKFTIRPTPTINKITKTLLSGYKLVQRNS